MLLWLLAHLAGVSRFWAAQSQGSQHHARTTHCASAWMCPARGRQSPRTHPRSVPVPGCVQPRAGKASAPVWASLPGLDLPWLFSKGCQGTQGHCRGKHPGVCALCVWIQGQAAPGSPSELQPGWRCASALQTAGQSMSNPMLLWILLRENSKTTRSPWTPQLAPQHGVAEVFGSPLSRVEPLQCEGAL